MLGIILSALGVAAILLCRERNGIPRLMLCHPESMGISGNDELRIVDMVTVDNYNLGYLCRSLSQKVWNYSQKP